MRIKVVGENQAARTVRGYLSRSRSVAVVETFPNITLYLEQNNQLTHIVVDGVEGDLEREVVNGIAAKTSVPIQLHRDGGIQKENELLIILPETKDIEVGILNGILKYIQGEPGGWLWKLKSGLGL